MVLVLSLHAVSFFVYMVAIVVTLLSVGGPHWYRTQSFYGGLWKDCELKKGHPEVCRRLTAADTSGQWKATEGLLLSSLFLAAFAGVFIIVIGCKITRYALEMRDVQLSRGTLVASTLLNLTTGLLILTATLIFPFWFLENSKGIHTTVERDWAYDLGILGGAVFIANGFLQGGILLRVTRMPELLAIAIPKHWL